MNIDESAWLIGLKGHTIDYDNQLVDESSEFLEKMTEIEHELYDLYMPSNNKFLPPVFEYKIDGMKRTEGYENEYGRMLNSAFILRIPIFSEDE